MFLLHHHRSCHCHHGGDGSAVAWLVGLVVFVLVLPYLIGAVILAAAIVGLWKGGWMVGRYIAGRRHP